MVWRVHDEEIVEQKVGQRVATVRPHWPIGFPVETIEEGEIGIQPCAIRTEVFLPQVKGVFRVVQVADLQVAVDRSNAFEDLG